MKTATPKTNTATYSLQVKSHAAQPFFQKKENQSSSFRENEAAIENPFFTPLLQPKLSIGQPGDKHEQEADAMVDQVVQKLAENNIQPKSNLASPILQNQPSSADSSTQSGTPSLQLKCAECDPEEKLQPKEEEPTEETLQLKPIFKSKSEPPEEGTLQRKCSTCGKEESIQRKGNSDLSTASPDLESQLNSTKGGGSPLPEGTQNQMEGAFGADFSGVRVHTNSGAVQMNQELGAQAFTHGGDVYFGAGKYNPGSTEGGRLLGHELTHVVQQGEGTLRKKEIINNFSNTAPTIQLLRARGLLTVERDRILRQMDWMLPQIERLESERNITTEEAERIRNNVERFMQEARDLRVTREATSEEARELWVRGRHLIRLAALNRRFIRGKRSSAELARGEGRRLHLISDFRVSPPVIRVNEGESSRISFVLREPAESINWYILNHEGGGDVATSYRSFAVNDLNPGYKFAIWNGTFERGGNQPPDSGTYRMRLTIRSRDGRGEELWEQIRIENPDSEVVHPRHSSGSHIQSLHFNGSQLVITDSAGNDIVARAVSGLKPNHRRSGGTDYTRPEYQWEQDRGPLPARTYQVSSQTVQQLQVGRGGTLQFPSGATPRAWGNMRIWLEPTHVGNRSDFFIHLDVGNDGTAGCIGIHPGDEGKFNSIVSLISQMPSGATLPVVVEY